MGIVTLFRHMVPGLSVVNISKRNVGLLSSESSIPLYNRKAYTAVSFKKRCVHAWLGLLVTRIAFNRTTQLGSLFISDNTGFCLGACFCVLFLFFG